MQPPESGSPSIFGRFASAVRSDWRSRARPAQIPPVDYSVFLELAGRGSGKTWSASNYVNEQAASGVATRIALIGATANDVRYTMVEGVSGILATARAGERPEFEPGKMQLTWPSGALARLYSADTPDALRGPEHDLAWCDELAAWRRADETWSNLLLTMRAGAHPRIIVTTTPKPTRLIRELVSRDGKDGVVVRRMSTYDNAANLPPSFFHQLIRRFEGTRLARQELLAELLEDVPGALWNRDVLEETRVDSEPKELERVVIAVDPAGSTSEGADETGILICARGADGHGYVLSDQSGRYAPTEWAHKVVNAFHARRADAVIIEKNYGGDMAAATIASVDSAVMVKEINSSRGKVLRAEPVSSLFEQRRVHLVGSHPELEDQCCSFTSDWDRRRDGSPDRVDALVFALSELLLQERPGGFIRTEALLQPADAADGAVPVDMPHQVESVFACASIVEAEPDALAITHFAVTGGNPALVVLDWTVTLLEQSTLDEFFPATAARLEELVKLTGSRSSFAPLLCEPAGFGMMLLEQGKLRGHRVMPLADEELLAKPLPTRLIEAANYLHAGSLKLSREAFDKRVSFRSVLRNHLCAELAAFSLADAKPKIGPLAASLATGALHSFGDRQWLDVWRACLNPLQPGPLGAARKAIPPPPPAPVRRPDADVLGPNHPAAIRAAKLRAESEARCEAESAAARANARIREARLVEEFGGRPE